MEYTKEEKNAWKEQFHKIDRTIYGGYMWKYKYRLGELLDFLSKKRLIKDFQNCFDNVPDEPSAATLNKLLESVKSQYRIFTYIDNDYELWSLVKV